MCCTAILVTSSDQGVKALADINCERLHRFLDNHSTGLSCIERIWHLYVCKVPFPTTMHWVYPNRSLGVCTRSIGGPMHVFNLTSPCSTFDNPIYFHRRICLRMIHLPHVHMARLPHINDYPILLLLHGPGGPGFESPRPTECSGWLKTALTSFRVVLMDQRGTGRSSQITVKNLAKIGTPEAQAEYLSFFRWVWAFRV